MDTAVRSQPWTDVVGKRVLLTGATGGIGLAAARRLAAMGAELTLVGRSASRARQAVAAIGRPVDVLLADLSSQASVRQLAADVLTRYDRLDVLINNAGAIYRSRRLSVDGLELTWAVNHLAPFLLTSLLVERLISSAPARIITTSSAAHAGARIPYDDLQAEHSYARFGYTRYGQTKLANILFTVELARRLSGTGVTANCFHPGFVATAFNRNNGPLMRLGMLLATPFARRPDQGADTLVWLATSPQVNGVSGTYFVDRRPVQPSQAAQDVASAARLWQISEHQIAVSTASR
jgi:retinol dehydrogenase-14